MNKNLLEKILKKLKSKGCDESDVIFAEDSTISSSSRLGKIEKTEVSEIKEIGIRAIINKKQSIVSSSNIEEKNIDKLIEKVVEMAKVEPEDEYCGLANEKEIKKSFTSIDMNKAGVISPNEFSNSPEVSKLPDEYREEMFSEIDLNND